MNNSTKRSNIQTLKQWTIKTYRNVFRKKNFYNKVPLIKWLPNYTTEDAVGDLVAGITVGLTVIPQALAYSGIAGLPPAVRFFFFVNIFHPFEMFPILFFFLAVWIIRIIYGMFCLYFPRLM